MTDGPSKFPPSQIHPTMFSAKALLAAITVTVVIGSANAVNYTGTANLGFYGTTNCGCPPFNGPFAVAIPTQLVGDAVCCDDSVTITYEGETTTAVFSAIYDTGSGTENIALSALAFGALAGFPEDTSLSPATWFFN
ncbi:hypothetical protein DFH07DRAFT_1037246 [Mycena maculata]|uniref:Uncharacterized protein n=1 Tax=Mycena maculata TaxID=230809 RepID=A0AAD7INE0_9AGAR|nr:hypothetical protein DFH07DRAFT_1037246 [Mycena maculata]